MHRTCPSIDWCMQLFKVDRVLWATTYSNIYYIHLQWMHIRECIKQVNGGICQLKHIYSSKVWWAFARNSTWLTRAYLRIKMHSAQMYVIRLSVHWKYGIYDELESKYAAGEMDTYMVKCAIADVCRWIVQCATWTRWLHLIRGFGILGNKNVSLLTDLRAIVSDEIRL